MKRLLVILVILNLKLVLFSQTLNFKDSADIYFNEIRINSNHFKDLWNLDLYGPLLLVNQQSGKMYANFPDSAGVLKQDGNIFTGILPEKINIANTSVLWNGRRWAMIMLPLPENRSDRLDLLSHELFHRSQPALGFHLSNSDNNHLDQRGGRVYLRMELEALSKALSATTSSDALYHLANAIFFRNTRYSLFPAAREDENKLELNEGMASYTGVMMSGRNEPQTKEFFEKGLVGFQTNPTFVRSFAYVTTPVYGFILSSLSKNWNKEITDTTNLTDYFTKAFRLSIPVNLCADCMSQYGYERILNEETKREEENEQRIAAYKKILIEQPHLVIKLEKMNISFDPRNIVPIEGYGTVYPSMRISDVWGILTVKGGALLGSNWDRVNISEPSMNGKDTISGNGWVLVLNNAYIVEKNFSDGNYTIRKK
jgi:hypothetical protein